jgi:hypothetical protein
MNFPPDFEGGATVRRKGSGAAPSEGFMSSQETSDTKIVVMSICACE